MDKILYDCLVGSQFTFKYKCENGRTEKVISFATSKEDKKKIVYVVDGDTQDEEVDVSDYAVCVDWDELASALAKKFISNNTGTVRVNICVDDNGYEGTVTLKENGDLIQEETEYQLTISPSMDMYTMNVIAVSEDDVDSIREMFDDENCDDLYDFCQNNTVETIEYVSLFGDEETDIIEYEIENDECDVIEEGEFQVCENNAFNYNGVPFCNKMLDNKEKYLLLHVDEVASPTVTYDVPKNFDIKKLHFMKSDPFDKSVPLYFVDGYGDTVVTLYGAHYQGVELPCDPNDDGTYGNNKFYLFVRDDKTGEYELESDLD